MDLGLTGKKALVTGASAGLGAAAAETLAAEGADVIVNSRDPQRLEAAAKRIVKATGASLRAVAADVATDEGRQQVVDACKEIWGEDGPEVFVANTGGPPPGLFLDHSADAWSDAHKLLLDSAVGLTRAFMPGMIDRKWGRLIYITSVAVLQPEDALILSNSLRAAVTGFCKTVANTYGQHGITANCVCPGFTATERLSKLAENRAAQSGKTADEVLEDFAALAPVRRLGDPSELAAVIAFLASDRAGFVTGASIPVDGGYHRGLL